VIETYNDTDFKNTQGVIPHVGKVFVPQDFYDYAERIKEEQLRVDFKRYKMSLMNLTRPAERKFWEKIEPDLTKEHREALKTARIEQARMDDIALHGMQSEDDFMFMWKRQQEENKKIPIQSEERLKAQVPRNQWMGTILERIVEGWAGESVQGANTYGDPEGIAADEITFFKPAMKGGPFGARPTSTYLVNGN